MQRYIAWGQVVEMAVALQTNIILGSCYGAYEPGQDQARRWSQGIVMHQRRMGWPQHLATDAAGRFGMT
jgi:hypothetical protein